MFSLNHLDIRVIAYARHATAVAANRFEIRRTALMTTIATLLLSTSTAGTGLAADKSWNAGSGPWNNGFSWTPLGVPVGTDNISIGDLPGIQNGTVTMGHAESVGYGTLEISDGMTLDLNGTELVSFGVATITGANSRLIVRPNPGINIHDFQGILHLETGARLELRNDVPVRIFDDSWSSGTISGWGSVLVNSADPFINNGIIRPDQGKDIVFTQGNADPVDLIDLDGTTGNGELQMDQRGAILEINAGGLQDSFSGTINLVSEARLEMFVDNGWTADANSLIDVQGIIDIEPLPSARIDGYPVVLAGDINVGGFSGHLEVNATATLQSGLSVTIGSTDRVEFDNQATINGGSYTLGNGAQLDFDSSTTVAGGTFTTFGIENADGDVDFNGLTTWSGNVSINGRAQQNGNAIVSGTTVITAELFDFNGEDGLTNWTINAPLTINTDSTKTHPFDFFEGEIGIGGALQNKLTVNLTGGQQSSWVMDGVMHLSGFVPLFVTRLSGSMVLGSGEFNISNTKVDISSDVLFMPTATMNFEAAGSELRMSGETWLREGMTISGSGTLRNGVNGIMWLYDGGSLGQAGLTNDGLLALRRYGNANLAAFTSVDRFTNSAGGTLSVRIGGYTLGDEHDHLLVTGAGGATLGGELRVSLHSATGDVEPFAPEPGDEFTILTSAGNVSGTFVNNPSTQSGARRFDWTVVYGTNDVTLRLDSIECDPCDTNCDGSVNQFDIDPFIATLVSNEGCSPCAGDANGNGTTNQFDINAFIACIAK